MSRTKVLSLGLLMGGSKGSTWIFLFLIFSTYFVISSSLILNSFSFGFLIQKFNIFLRQSKLLLNRINFYWLISGVLVTTTSIFLEKFLVWFYYDNSWICLSYSTITSVWYGSVLLSDFFPFSIIIIAYNIIKIYSSNFINIVQNIHQRTVEV